MSFLDRVVPIDKYLSVISSILIEYVSLKELASIIKEFLQHKILINEDLMYDMWLGQTAYLCHEYQHQLFRNGVCKCNTEYTVIFDSQIPSFKSVEFRSGIAFMEHPEDITFRYLFTNDHKAQCLNYYELPLIYCDELLIVSSDLKDDGNLKICPMSHIQNEIGYFTPSDIARAGYSINSITIKGFLGDLLVVEGGLDAELD